MNLVMWAAAVVALLGVLIFVPELGHFLGQSTLEPPTIGTVLSGLPAANSGLMPGDKVEAIDGRHIRYWEELEQIVSDSLGKTLRFEIRRGQSVEERDVTPVELVRRG